MTFDAAKLSLDEDLYDTYKPSSPHEFTNNCSAIWAKLFSIVIHNGWTNHVNGVIPVSFPNYARIHSLFNLTVSSKQTLLLLQRTRNHPYLCSIPRGLSDIITKTAWSQFTETKISNHIWKGLVLRILLDCCEISGGMCNTLYWQTKYFVSEPYEPANFNMRLMLFNRTHNPVI